MRTFIEKTNIISAIVGALVLVSVIAGGALISAIDQQQPVQASGIDRVGADRLYSGPRACIAVPGSNVYLTLG